MTKRIVSLIIALIIPLTLLTACGKELTAKEYVDELSDGFKEFSAAFKEMTPAISAATTLEGVKSGKAAVDSACDKAEKALDKLAKLNAPSSLKDKHKNMVTAIDNEKKFLKAAKKLFSAKSVEDITTATSELAAVQNAPAEQQFPSVFMALLLEAKAKT